MHHVLAVDQLEQVNDLEADVNRLNLSEEGRLAFDLAARHYRFLHGGVGARLGHCLRRRLIQTALLLVGRHLTLLFDFQTGFLLQNVLFETVALALFNLSVDNAFRQLAKGDNSRRPRVVDLGQDQRLLPQVVE